MASSQSESLHLHLDESNITENETNTVKSTDLNVTWDYSDESSMETGNTTQGKRPRPLSDSENSDLYEHDERGSTKNTMPTNQPRLSHMGYRMDCGSTVMEESEPLMQQNEANIIVSSHSDASPTSKITSNDTDHDVPPQAGTPETGSSPHGALNQADHDYVSPNEVTFLSGATNDTALDTNYIIRGWQQTIGSSTPMIISEATPSVPQENTVSWSTDVEKLTMILSEALNEVFLEVLTFTRSLHYDELLGVTVNNDTTFVFDLQGKAGLPITSQKGWTRQEVEPNQIKIKVEDALCRVCWEQAVNVTSLRIEGTTTIIVDNKDTILTQLDQMSFAPVGKMDTNSSITEYVTIKEASPFKSKRKNKGEEKLKKIERQAKESEGEDTEKNTFDCEVCGKTYKTYSALSFHKKQHTTVPSIHCEIEGCTKIFRTKQQLACHLLVHSGVKNHLCGICGRKFGHPSNLNKHQKFYCGEKMYKCEKCDRSFKLEEQLSEHMQRHEEGTFRCEICSKNFNLKRKYELHIKNHNVEKRFQCDVCFKMFYFKSAMRSHKKIHTSKEKSVDRKKYECHLCERSYANLSGLTRHKLAHDENKRFVCGICNKSFVDKYYHSRHMELHGKEAEHKCEFCGKLFKWPQYLQRHLRIHTGEKPYKCNGCNRAFKFTSSLAQHRKKCLLILK